MYDEDRGVFVDKELYDAEFDKQDDDKQSKGDAEQAYEKAEQIKDSLREDGVVT